MSRRKDRERFDAMKRQNPDYTGFRGYGVESDATRGTPLQTMTCSVCGRKRNVPVGTYIVEGEDYVCLSCSGDAAQDQSDTPAEEDTLSE